MPVEMGMWRIDGDTPRRLSAATLPSEATLEQYLEKDPSLLGDRLLVIGRQVRTPHGKYIDLLGMDGEGNLNVLELKRDKTPRDVVAQVLDYGSWVSTLDRDSIIDLANTHLDEPLEAAFEGVFGASLPDELNAALQLTIVATDLDPGSERIVTYLRTFGVPVNAVFFSYLEDDDRRYLARSWLASDDDGGTDGSPYSAGKRGKRAEWNGRDWYVSFGADEGGRSWADGRKYGFVCAGGGPWYSRTLRDLPLGARVNVCIPGRGYVGIGEVTGPRCLWRVSSWSARTSPQRAQSRRPTTRPSGSCPSGGSRPCRPIRRTGRRACSPTRTAPASCARSSPSTGWPATSTCTTREAPTTTGFSWTFTSTLQLSLGRHAKHPSEARFACRLAGCAPRTSQRPTSARLLSSPGAGRRSPTTCRGPSRATCP